MIRFCSLVFSILLFVTFAIADNLKVFKFTDSELNELKVRKVRGADNKTVYSVGSNENGNYLKAIADNAASGLGKETKVNLNETPFINITWKVEEDLKGIKENTKKGHDFAARVFVIKKLVQLHYQTEQLIMCFPAIVKLDFILPVPILKNQLIMFYQALKII